jgi:hypothetical protein
MDAAFGDPEIKQRAQWKLGIIRQGNRDFQDFCYEPTKHGTVRAYRMQAAGARQVSTGRTGVPRSCAKY